MADSVTDSCAEDDFFAEEDEAEEDEEVEDESYLEYNDDVFDPDAARFALLPLGLALLLPEVVALAFGAGGNGGRGAASEPESHPVGR